MSENMTLETGYRLLNSKYPTILLFDDVADSQEFEALYELQKLTNPRLLQEVGDIALIDSDDIPYHCQRGRSYAVAPFTHINRDGTRFADGSFGALYIADEAESALFEVYHHQNNYWQNVDGLKYDRLVLRTLKFTFDDTNATDICGRPMSDDVYHSSDYSAAQAFGREIRKANQYNGIKYNSVRCQGATCWAMFTPKVVHDVIQCYHIEMIWDGEKIDSIKKIDELSKSPLHKFTN